MEQLSTMAELARELGVTRQQIATWFRRRESNGFPEPVTETTLNDYRYVERLWRLAEAKEWHANYVPNRGGRPRKS